VHAGARGWVRVAGVVPVAVRILAVDPGRSWTWRVGPVTMRHLVSARGDGGCEVAIELTAHEPVQSAVAGTYGPVITVLLANLARIADERGGARA
jgi:hypothetical protein